VCAASTRPTTSSDQAGIRRRNQGSPDGPRFNTPPGKIAVDSFRRIEGPQTSTRVGPGSIMSACFRFLARDRAEAVDGAVAKGAERARATPAPRKSMVLGGLLAIGVATGGLVLAGGVAGCADAAAMCAAAGGRYTGNMCVRPGQQAEEKA